MTAFKTRCVTTDPHESHSWPEQLDRDDPHSWELNSCAGVDGPECAWCGAEIWSSGEQWCDEFGSAFCETLHDDCPACQDGESHPHSIERG